MPLSNAALAGHKACDCNDDVVFSKLQCRTEGLGTDSKDGGGRRGKLSVSVRTPRTDRTEATEHPKAGPTSITHKRDARLRCACEATAIYSMFSHAEGYRRDSQASARSRPRAHAWHGRSASLQLANGSLPSQTRSSVMCALNATCFACRSNRNRRENSGLSAKPNEA